MNSTDNDCERVYPPTVGNAGAELRADPKPDWLVEDAHVRYVRSGLLSGRHYVTEYRHRSDGWYARIRSHARRWSRSDGWWVWVGALRAETEQDSAADQALAREARNAWARF